MIYCHGCVCKSLLIHKSLLLIPCSSTRWIRNITETKPTGNKPCYLVSFNLLTCTLTYRFSPKVCLNSRGCSKWRLGAYAPNGSGTAKSWGLRGRSVSLYGNKAHIPHSLWIYLGQYDSLEHYGWPYIDPTKVDTSCQRQSKLARDPRVWILRVRPVGRSQTSLREYCSVTPGIAAKYAKYRRGLLRRQS